MFNYRSRSNDISFLYLYIVYRRCLMTIRIMSITYNTSVGDLRHTVYNVETFVRLWFPGFTAYQNNIGHYSAENTFKCKT